MHFSVEILTYFSIFIWLLPPLRQFKTFIFKYFLILGIADLLVILFDKYLRLTFLDFYLIISYCLLVALQKADYLKNKKELFLGLSLIVAILSILQFRVGIHILFLSFLHLMIIFRILYLFVMKVAERQTINFFYLVLAFYEFTIILKFLNFIFELKVEAETYFYITTGFELLVGIFFTMFREDSQKLAYKLK